MGDQKVFSQPSQYWNFLYQGGEIHGLYASSGKYTNKILLRHVANMPVIANIATYRQMS